ncbi:MAG: hypothetical protein B0D92_02605 [Spirochaeta sp. LUC14_002_19_P3]|nr:MAG: hypothetical protein B0D92_02605 [Spirochaeta sp. LUC14_002_19_P3]
MKMTPELTAAQANMAPGIITAEGFLGNDTRNLSTIIDEDAQIMSRLHLNRDTIVEKLRHFMEEGRKGLGEPVTVDTEWLVKTDEARGRLTCPWEDNISRKTNVTIERKDTGEKLFYTDLSIHLLEAHGFLEGRGSSFRLNLESVKHVLKM